MIATAIGSGAAIEGQAFQLNLTQDYGATSQWKINWGDGSAAQTVAGNVAQVAHTFADGPSSPVITTELYKPDGKFAGLSPDEVSVGSDGSVFARNADGTIYRLDGQTWTQLPITFSRFTVRNANEVWGTDTVGNVSIWNGTALTAFPGRQLKNINISSDGTTWGIDTANVIVRRNGSVWTNMPGQLVDVEAANGGGAHGIAANGTLYYFYNNVWTNFTGILADISQGNDGVLFGATDGGTVVQWNGSNTWVTQSWANFKSLSANNVNDIWGIDLKGAVAHWNGSTLTRVPMTLTPVAVANAAPTITFNATSPVIATQTFNPQLVVQDAGTDTLSYLALNWGDSSPVEVIPASQALSHRYAFTGNYSLSAVGFDEDTPLPPATATANGTVVVEAERFINSVAVGSSTWQRFALGNQSTVRGVELSAAPTNYGNTTAGSRLDYQVQFDRTGVQYAWLRMRSPLGTAAVQVGLNGVPFSYGGQGVSSSSDQWQWVHTVLGRTGDPNLSVTTTLGAATLNVWAMNGRVQIDQLLLTPDAAFIPSTTQPEIRNFASGYASSVTSVLVQNGYVVPTTAAATEGQPYLLNLVQNYGSGSQWKINWGDGSAIQTVVGNVGQVSHTYADGPSSPVITTELYKPDGKYAGFSPAEVSVGTDGSVFARNVDGGIYRLDGQNWTRLPINFSRFSVRTVNEIWGLDEIGNVFIWNGTSTTPFSGRQFANISIADDGWVWGIDTAGVAARAYGATTWTSYPAYFPDLEAAPGGGAYGINTLGNLYYFNTSNAQWTSFPGNLKDLSHSADGSLIGVNSSNNIYRWNGNGTWTQLTWGNLTSISVHNANDIWGLDVNGAVAHWDGTALTRVPTTITNVSVANAAPSLRLVSAGPAIATEPFRPQLRYSDQGTDTLTNLAINWGDGSPLDIIAASQQPSHRYTTQGNYTVTAAAFDEDKPLPAAGTAAAVILTSGYAVVGTTAVITSPSTTPQLPIATFDSGTVKQGANVLLTVVDNDFDPNGEAISLVGLQITNSTAAPVSTLTTTGLTATIESGAIRLTATTTATIGQYEFAYFIQDAVGNRVRQILAVNLLSSTAPTTSANPYNNGGDVTTANAEFVTRSDADMQIPSIGIPISIERKYDSSSKEDQGFGPGWTFRYGSRLELNAANTDFVWITPGGERISFVTGTTTSGVTTFATSNSLSVLNSATATRQTVGTDLVTRIRTKVGDIFEYRHSLSTDASVKLYRIEDRNQNAQAIIYTQGVLTRLDDVTNSTAPVTRLTFTFNANKISAITDNAGRTWNYQYGQTATDSGRLTSALSPAASGAARPTVTYQYSIEPNLVGSIVNVAERDGSTTAYRYYSNGRLAEVNSSKTGKQQYGYDDVNRARQTVDAYGAATVEKFSTAGLLTDRTYPDGSALSQVFDTAGHLTQATEPGLPATSYTYDAKGNLLSQKDQDGATTAYEYDATFSQLTKITFGSAVRHTLLLDAYGNVIRDTDAAGNVTTKAYDSRGQLISEIDPRGFATSTIGDFETNYAYNAYGQPTQRQLARTTADVTLPNRPTEQFSYDNYFNLQLFFDSTGLVTTYQYDLVGHLLSQSLPAPYADNSVPVLTTRFTYDDFGRVIKQTDPADNETRFEWGDNGQIVRQINPDGSDIRTQYDRLGHPIANREELGFTTLLTYDTLGRLTATRLPDGSQLKTVYGTNGKPTSTIAANGAATTYEYDSVNKAQLKKKTDSIGGIESWTYNTRGELATYTDQLGAITRFSYDNNGRLIEAKLDTQRVEQSVYDAVGNVTATVTYDIAGLGTIPADLDTLAASRIRRASIDYDTMNRPIRWTDAAGNVRSETYDAAGRRKSTTDARGATTQFTYDLAGRAFKTIQPPATSGATAGTTSVYLDANGNQVKLIDAAGNQTKIQYDNRNRAFKTTDALNQVSSVVYDAAGHVISATDPLIHTSTSVYDARGRLIKLQRPDPDAAGPQTAPVWSYVYDAIGDLTSMTDPLQRITESTFDSDGRRTGTFSPVIAGQLQSTRLNSYFTYDKADHLLSQLSVVVNAATGTALSTTAAAERTINFSYDTFGRPKRQTSVDPDGVLSTQTLPSMWTENSYNGFGDIISKTDHLSRITTLAVDALGRTTTLTAPDPDGTGPLASPVTRWTYDANGNIVSQTDANNNVTSYQFDALNRQVASIMPDTNPSDSIPGATTTFQYDVLGRMIGMTDSLGRTTNQQYDAIGRLLNVLAPAASTGDVRAQTQIAYDAVGNITSTTDPLGRQTINQYDGLNRLILTTMPDPDLTDSVAAPVYQFGYDLAGRQTSTIDPLGNSTRYSFDAIDRMIRVDLPDLDNNATTPVYTLQYRYDDVANTRTSIDSLGRSTITAFDNLGRPVRETMPVPDPALSTTVPINQYKYDSAGNLAQTTDPLGRITLFTYDALDRLNSKALPDAGGGSPTLRWSYDAAGNITSTTDPLGRITTRAYDTVGQLTSVTLPRTIANDATTSATTQFAYDLEGNETSVTDPLLRQTQYQYDNLNRLVKDTAPDPDLTDAQAAPATSYQYDLVGNLVKTIDPLNRQTTTQYDRLDRPTIVTLPNPDTSSTASGPASTTRYDVLGNVTQSIDVMGRSTAFTYDRWNRRTGITLPDPDDGAGPLTSPQLTTAYDAVGNVISTADQLSRTTLYRYDALNRQTGVTLPDPDTTDLLPAPTTAASYDLVGNLISSTDTLGRTTSLQYDALNRLVLQTLPDAITTDALPGPQTRYTYDLASNELTVKDPLSHITTYTYDTRDRVATQTLPDPDGTGALLAPVVTYQYDQVDNVTSQTDQLNRVTTFAYDRLNRQTSVTLPDADTTDAIVAPISSTVYDAVGNSIAAIDPRGNRTEWVYDAWNRPTQQKLPNPTNGTLATGPSSQTTYDFAGNVTASSDATGQSTNFAYDALDRLTQTTSPDPDGTGPGLAPQTTRTYSSAGDLATVAQRVNATTNLTTIYAYDNWHRQVQVTDPRGSTTKSTYDTQSNVKSVTDSSSNVTTYAYDALNQLVTETDPLNKARTYQYDLDGNQTVKIDRNNLRTEYTYDALDRPLDELWKNGTTTTRTISTRYDNAGQVTSVTDPDSTTNYTYDRLDRLVTTVRSGSGTPSYSLAYSYDIGDNLVSEKQTIGSDIQTTAYTFDALDRVSRVSQSGTAVRSVAANYTYTANSQVASIQRFQSTTVNTPAASTTVLTNFTYDTDQRQTAITHKAGATTLAGYGLTYDAASRLTQVNSTLDGITNFTLDAAGQLTAATRTVGANESYTYDANGNRTGTGVTIGPNNQVTNDGKYAYTYDAEGNRTTRTLLVGGQPTGPSTQYIWDQHNRLTKVKELSATGTTTASTSYLYDANDQRTSRSVDSNGDNVVDKTDRFVLDGDTVTAVTNLPGAIQNRYLHGADVDEVLADIGTSGNVNWTLADFQKTIRDIASYDGTVSSIANHRTFDSFGKMLSQSNAAVDELFGYTGRELDTQTGLNYYRDRWYDSAVGKFLSNDPLGFAGGDTNLSRYVGNAPNDYTDPTGNSWLSNLIDKFTEEVNRVVNQVDNFIDDTLDDAGNAIEDAYKDTVGFVKEHPYIVAGALAVTGFGLIGGFGLLAQASVGIYQVGLGMGQALVQAGGMLPNLLQTVNSVQLFANAGGIGANLGSLGGFEVIVGLSSNSALGNVLFAGAGYAGSQGYNYLFDNQGNEPPTPPTIAGSDDGDQPGNDSQDPAQPSIDDPFSFRVNLSYDSLAQSRREYQNSLYGFDLPSDYVSYDRPRSVSSNGTSTSNNNAVKSVPSTTLGQTGAVAGAAVGSVVSDVYGFFSGLAGAPRAIISGDAGRALGDRAVAFSTRVNGGQFTGTFKQSFDVGVMLTLDVTGLSGPVGAMINRDFGAGQSLNGWDRARQLSFGVSGAATAAAGGPVVVASTAAKMTGAAKLAGTLPVFGKKLVTKAADVADEAAENSSTAPKQRFQNTTPSPALEGSPYHHSSVAARQTDNRVLYRKELIQGEAADLGYTNRIAPQRAPFNSHGQDVFSNGRNYISRDIGSDPTHAAHNGGVWKKFDLRGNRLGTFDANLNPIGD